MTQPPQRRRPSSDPRAAAEALFKRPTAPPPTPDPSRPPPEGKETVTLRIDRSVLEHFQADGPGWQDRINDALRRVADEATAKAISVDDLNASNDE